jgi:isoquinoline 1-oxidoreductase beta subunit
MGKWTRRTLITAGSLLGGGLVLGVGGIAFAPNRLGLRDKSAKDAAHLTTWLKITPDNRIIAIIPHCEMGQGAQTGLAMMLADELDADWDTVTIQEAPAEDAYANGHLIAGFLRLMSAIPTWLTRALEYGSYRISRVVPLQITGGSSSTITTGQYGMRVAGAAAKAMLLEAAATQWDVPIDECTASQSLITHAASERNGTYAEFANRAASLEPPQNPTLKTRDQFTLMGHSTPRPDLPDKVVGKAVYAVDVVLPEMLYATVAASPVPGGALQSVDHGPAMAVAGVRRVVELPDAVAVVAEGFTPALKGVRALAPTFSASDRGTASTQELYEEHARVLSAGDGDVDHLAGDGAAALATADELVEAEYRVPYLAHASMEPMAATVQVTADHCEVWAGTQDPLNARSVAAKAAGLDDEQVVFHNTHPGGSFGRRLPGAFDYVDQAVRIASALSPTPVKLIWSREEDMQHDFYRPALLARCRGGLNGQGEPLCWVSEFSGPGDFGAARPYYGIPHQEIIAHSPPENLRHGSWRSVGNSQQGFFMESFIDELAVAADKDPYQYRRDLLSEKPRHQAVLDRVTEMANWNAPLPAGHGKGIAIVECFGTSVAEVAQVSVDDRGRIKVHNVWAAVDCGFAVNPDQGLAQIQGGIMFGLSAALYQEITLKDGAVEQRNFPDYPSVTLADAPELQVEFVDSGGTMGGLGEPGVPPIAAAVANAVYAATGQRLRSLPLRIS